MTVKTEYIHSLVPNILLTLGWYSISPPNSYIKSSRFGHRCKQCGQNWQVSHHTHWILSSCLAGAVLTDSPVIAATQVRYPTSACEMVIWSPSQTGGFPPGTLVSSHTKTIRTQSPTSMINISCITCFVIFVKFIKVKLLNQPDPKESHSI